MPVSFDELEKIKPLLREYVEQSPKSVERQWESSTEISQRPFHRYAGKESHKIAHFLLMFAAVDTAELVTMPENARALLKSLYGSLSDDYFKPSQIDLFSKHIQDFSNHYNLGSSYEQIPEILDSINHFVQENAKGDLVSYAKKFATPEEMVKEVGNNIPYIGGSRLDHVRMYMRWMVRAPPDLEIFKNFSSKQLQIPLTSFMRNIAVCLGICSKAIADWDHPQEIDQERKRLTQFALELFPEDPAKIDYPFFMLGRWIRDQNLSLQSLRNWLQFLKKTYVKLQKPPITFNASKIRQESTFEKRVREELEKFQFMFSFEPLKFTLSNKKGEPQNYTPDFILPRCRKQRKIVILEPHGIWTPKQKRKFQLGSKTSYFWAFPSEINIDEIKFVNKLRLFMKLYSKMYYLILIVPSNVKYRVEINYPDTFNQIYEGEDIPKMLFDLQKNMK